MKSPLIWTFDYLVCLDAIKIRFRGQNHRLKFAVKGGKLLPKWTVRPQMMSFFTALYTVYMLQRIKWHHCLFCFQYTATALHAVSYVLPISGSIEAVCVLYQK